ncbi:MAG: response regulator [bacterium]|nr:MAG: response regulator [bacterium]
MRRRLIAGLAVIFLAVLAGGIVVSVLMARLQTLSGARLEVEVFHLTMDRLTVNALSTVERVRRSMNDQAGVRESIEKVHSFRGSLGAIQQEFVNGTFADRGCGMCHENPGLLTEKIGAHIEVLDNSFSEMTLMASLYMTRKEGVVTGPVLDKLNASLDGVKTQLDVLTGLVAPMIEHIDREAAARLLRINRIHGITVVLTVLLVLAGTVLIIVAINKRVRLLTKGADAIVQGDYHHRIDLRGEDELSVLADRFNFMAETVANREMRIMEKKEQLEDLNEALEGKVQERTREVQLSRDELKQKLDELEASNQQLQASYAQLEFTARELRSAQGKLQENYNILKEMNAELQQVSEVKNKFLSIMSHELRTPLTVINGYLSLILEKDYGHPSPELKEIMKVVKDQARNQLSLIEDLLDLTRIESGEFRIHRQASDAAKLLTKVSESYLPRVDEKEIQLSLEMEKDLPKVFWDPQKVVQVLQNLIDNAIKFTPIGGRIVLSAKSKSDFIELKVVDNGIGIPQQGIDRIFDRFYQIDSSSTRQYGGSGLGLSIVKEIVQAHRGRIFVESREGEGTTFFILIPVGEPERVRLTLEDDAGAATDTLPAEYPQGNGEVVLVVDDDPAFLRMMDTILPREGYTVKNCEKARDAIEWVKQHGADIILLDLMMPEMDGFEACRRLKEDPETRSIPVLVVSASGGKEVTNRVRDVGADDHLTKPFDQFDILYRIHTILAESREEMVIRDGDGLDGEKNQAFKQAD